jgi:hypothetical protein
LSTIHQFQQNLWKWPWRSRSSMSQGQIPYDMLCMKSLFLSNLIKIVWPVSEKKNTHRHPSSLTNIDCLKPVCPTYNCQYTWVLWYLGPDIQNNQLVGISLSHTDRQMDCFSYDSSLRSIKTTFESSTTNLWQMLWLL